jgi:hypothetical protein
VLAWFGTGFEFMGRRGPKAVDLGQLSSWEFEFYKAFHFLRDGTSLPAKYDTTLGLTRAELATFIQELRKMSINHYWLAGRRVAADMGEPTNLARPPGRMDRHWAERQKEEEIYWLDRVLNPPKAEAEARRRKIWRDLVQANTYAALRKSCGRWAQLPDVRRAGLTPFPKHVVENAAQFIRMKQNQRFPRSQYGDDSRVEYLARGMAGIFSGVSPMTAIERLRNMKHSDEGPMWVTRVENHVLPKNERYCGCWRCRIETSQKVSKVTQGWYGNSLRFFMEVAATTRVPKEWRTTEQI